MRTLVTSGLPAYHAAMTDLGALYRAARVRTTALVTADGVDPDLDVPATPEWTVHDVVAHVVGVATDAATGNMEGAPGDEWTAAQVRRGRGTPIAELIAQWETHAAMLEGVLSASDPDGGFGAAVLDVHSHEADLRTALGLPLEFDDEFLSFAGGWLRPRLAANFAEAGLPSVELVCDDLDLFRGMFGRRTADEVRALGWSADAEPYLDVFFVFGRAAESLQERV